MMDKFVSINSNCIRRFLRTEGVVYFIARTATKKASKQSTVNKPQMKDYKLDSYLESLQSKGFIRSHKTYNPPSDVAKAIKAVCSKVMTDRELNNNFGNLELSGGVQRFKILTECMKIFNHEIFNSHLHKIVTINDLITYFKTPVRSTTSYDDLHASNDLPPNMHVMLNPVRFHPETDTMFGGVSAFPGRSVVVTGLKAKKKYKGFTAATPWEKAPKV